MSIYETLADIVGRLQPHKDLLATSSNYIYAPSLAIGVNSRDALTVVAAEFGINQEPALDRIYRGQPYVWKVNGLVGDVRIGLLAPAGVTVETRECPDCGVEHNCHHVEEGDVK